MESRQLGTQRVLVANRGEIACRIMRACRTLGMVSIAVHSEADAHAMHADMADVRMAIGPPPARASYLNIERLLAAAAAAQATAVHPGYGFLSESPDFARAVEAAGLVWIGPSAETMVSMGDKERARGIAVAAGLPILPGSRRFRSGESGLADAAEAVGYPLLVKAACGGGGIGMQRVDRCGELVSAVAATQAIAGRLFGDEAIYLERLIARPRHIEVQVFGDGRGGAIHLFERECSIQRRFQKVIEESPAPGLSAGLRAALLRGAIALAAGQCYRGPGTVEYLVDADRGDYFFLEMNTRIQVEHPVTEMVTGHDLIVMQMLQALGVQPDLRQTDVIQGHSIECRLYAENPEASFRPSPGRLIRLQLPCASDVRLDFGYRTGDEVSPYYDPLIGKIIVYGKSRTAALERMRYALAHTRVEGIASNRAFLERVIGHADFEAGRIDTLFIDQHRNSLLRAA